MEPEANQAKRKPLWRLSKSNARWLVFGYVVSFLIVRFDVTKHRPFEHPVPTLKAAWVAIPLALLSLVLLKFSDSDSPIQRLVVAGVAGLVAVTVLAWRLMLPFWALAAVVAFYIRFSRPKDSL